MSIEDEQLCRIAEWRTRPKWEMATRLGDTVKQLMKNRILRRQGRFGSVVGQWSQLLPSELSRHCKIVDISAGRLKVLVDSPSHMYELRLCSAELLKRLQQQCPRAQIKEIKFAIG